MELHLQKNSSGCCGVRIGDDSWTLRARVIADQTGVSVGRRRQPPGALESWVWEAAAYSIPGKVQTEEPRHEGLMH